MSDQASVAEDDPLGGAQMDDGGDAKGVVRIASVAALGGLLFGYDSAVVNGAVNALGRVYDISSGLLGFAVASALIGAATGALTAGRIADKVGRIWVMKIAAVLFFSTAIICALAPEGTFGLWVFIIFRLIGGAGVGFASVIAPAYIAEVSPARIRGRLGSLQQLAIVSGIFLALLINSMLARAAGGSGETLWFGLEAWRWMFLVVAFPAIIYGVLAFTIPESPRFLVAKQRIPEARKVLSLLLGEKNMEFTIDRIQQSLDAEKDPSWKDLKNKKTGKIYAIVWVGLGLAMLQQFVGINVIFYYSNVLWESVGFDESQAFTFSVLTSIINIATTIVAIIFVDKIGRKPLLIIGSSGMIVSLTAMAIVFGASPVVDSEPVLTGAGGPIALVAANVFVIAFGMSWGPIMWVLLGEMFPNRIRAAALSLATFGQWMTNFLVTVSFPGLRDISLGMTYGIYAVFAVISLIFAIRYIRETKGMTLEDMDKVLDEPAAIGKAKKLQAT
ncbi:sugar porter family MFS transporter [Corynebacterium sputi]|uniref:sugar porter family MFS transporter n=1 Tax=Corynebacterium sputi TaxID=489915 RepID=UPI00068827AB|nr:sugar porter family MFS transporter [Corynebacterium sputi]